MSPARPDPTTVPWHAVVNDEIGGWAVATAPGPTSQIDHRQAEIVADFVRTEAIARRIADDHNAILPGAARTPHHDAGRVRTDDEDLAIRRRELLDAMAASNAKRLDQIREREGRLL